MIKGCQKRMIFVKNTGSDLFDEAYFILKDDVPSNSELDGNIVRAATAIINQSGFLRQSAPKRRQKRGGVIPFLLGVAFASAIFMLVFCLVV
jgi:hypothetical protein